MMIRVGIIGTESSHAMAFARYFNLPDPRTGKMNYDDIRVTSVMGDAESAGRIAQEARVPYAADHVENMADQVDAVMIVNRKGSLHKRYALPFIKRCLPLFIDKPFTSDAAEAEELMEQIQSHGCGIMGGSGCKYIEAIKKIQHLTKALRKKDAFISAAISFDVMLDSPYDGMYFYASHLVEMCMEAFGYDVRGVQALRTGDSLLVSAQYERDAISLHFNSGTQKHACIIFAKEQTYYFDLDMTGIYEREAGYFADLLHGVRPSLSKEQLVGPIRVLDAIAKSEKTRELIFLPSGRSDGLIDKLPQ